MDFDAIVIGAGHAGCEAALALARLHLNTLLLTLNMDAIALMACNPVIGGTGKGHLVREIDALGGEMGHAIDETFLQSRTLNRGKGPAVYSLRAQADKKRYQAHMARTLFSQDRLTIQEGEVSRILYENRKVCGVKTTGGRQISAPCVILCAGVFLKSRIIIGERQWDAGPQGLLPANELSQGLAEMGFALRRFKTGTPARVDGRTIDFSKMTPQPGDDPVTPFSFLTDKPLANTTDCYLTYTNETTHQIIRENLHRAPMFTGAIKGTGARYCPSIEDKINRFADKDRHQVFLEPEGFENPEWYVQGMSSSMPEDVQRRMYQSVPGLENCVLTRLAYAIEYDCIDPTRLRQTLESLDYPGLYFAGQINGTSGYEEAAAQGLYAGINAALSHKGLPPFVLTRDMAYIGVMVDDLTTKGVDEPYRMMTSRAEHRLTLRQDNADLRLTALSHSIGLASDPRMARTLKKQADTLSLTALLSETRLYPTDQVQTWLQSASEPPLHKPILARDLLLRPGITMDLLSRLVPSLADFSAASREQAEISIKYEGYLKKQAAQLQKFSAMETRLLSDEIDYMQITALRIEARQKLTAQKPRSLGQAARIPGVSPADVAVLMVYLDKKLKENAT